MQSSGFFWIVKLNQWLASCLVIGFVLMKWVANKPFYTYNALYISVSSGSSVPCMVVDSIMSWITNAMGFYTGYFGHVTKYACMPHEYPCGFILGDDRLSIFWWSTEHFTTWFCLHFTPTSGYFIFSQSDFMKQVLSTWLSWRSAILRRKSISWPQDFKQATFINGEHSNICFYCNLQCCRSHFQAWTQWQVEL